MKFYLVREQIIPREVIPKKWLETESPSMYLFLHAGAFGFIMLELSVCLVLEGFVHQYDFGVFR